MCVCGRMYVCDEGYIVYTSVRVQVAMTENDSFDDEKCVQCNPVFDL